MTTISGSLSAKGISASLALGVVLEQISYVVTGTFVGTWTLERALTTDGTSWESVFPRPVDGPFSGIYQSRPKDVIRFRVLTYTSGTITYSFSDNDAEVGVQFDLDGREIWRATQAGFHLPGTLSVAGGVEGPFSVIDEGVEPLSAEAIILYRATSATVTFTGVGGAPGSNVILTGTTGTTMEGLTATSKVVIVGTVDELGHLVDPLLVGFGSRYITQPTDITAEPLTGGGFSSPPTVALTFAADKYTIVDARSGATRSLTKVGRLLIRPSNTPLTGEYNDDVAPFAFNITLDVNAQSQHPYATPGPIRYVNNWRVQGDAVKTYRSAAFQDYGVLKHWSKQSTVVAGAVGSRTMESWVFGISGVPTTVADFPTRSPNYALHEMTFSRQAGDGGTAPVNTLSKGQNYLESFYVYGSGVAANMRILSGGEWDYRLDGGASAAKFYGKSMVQLRGHKRQGVLEDAAWLFGRSGKMAEDSEDDEDPPEEFEAPFGWRYIFLNGGPDGIQGLDFRNGTYMAAKAMANMPSPTALNGIDFREYVYTDRIFSWWDGHIKGGSGTDAGEIRVGTAYLTPTEDGASLDIAGYIGLPKGTIISGGDVINGDVGITLVGLKHFFNDLYQGVYLVNHLSGGNVTEVKVLVPPVVNGAPPVDPISLYMRAETGGIEGLIVGDGSTTTVIQTDSTVTIEDYYVERLLRVETGACAGEIRTITAFDATTKAITVSVAFSFALEEFDQVEVITKPVTINMDWEARSEFQLQPSGGPTVVGGSVSIAGYQDLSVGNGLTAVGTTRADALQLAKQENRLTTVASGTGVVLPAGVVGRTIRVFQDGANVAQVYALASETIDGVAGATGVPLTNGKRCAYLYVAANTWVSYQLGVISA